MATKSKNVVFLYDVKYWPNDCEVVCAQAVERNKTYKLIKPSRGFHGTVVSKDEASLTPMDAAMRHVELCQKIMEHSIRILNIQYKDLERARALLKSTQEDDQ